VQDVRRALQDPFSTDTGQGRVDDELAEALRPGAVFGEAARVPFQGEADGAIRRDLGDGGAVVSAVDDRVQV